jgi:hypothetical protein
VGQDARPDLVRPDVLEAVVGFRRRGHRRPQPTLRSMMVAVPMPPPQHIVSSP